MSDESSKGQDPSKDIVEGFDLPQGEPTPPPASEEPTESGLLPAAFEPHVKRAEQKPSVVGKLIALVIIPALAVIGILLMPYLKSQSMDKFKGECKTTAEKFLAGLSDDTEDSVPAAYNLLHQDLQAELAAETVTEQYAAAARSLGKFRSLESIRWEEGPAGTASRSFRALAQFEKGTSPVWFRFARVTSDSVTAVKIAEYRFGAK